MDCRLHEYVRTVSTQQARKAQQCLPSRPGCLLIIVLIASSTPFRTPPASFQRRDWTDGTWTPSNVRQGFGIFTPQVIITSAIGTSKTRIPPVIFSSSCLCSAVIAQLSSTSWQSSFSVQDQRMEYMVSVCP